MRIQTIAFAILLPLFTMAETISFTYLGTNNDDLSPYHGLTMPATITIADISMSLDNVIAVTAIARDQTYLLMFGIGFSILLIAIFASAIVRLLTKFKWLSYVGLVFLIYLSTEMAIDGYFQIKPYISF